MQKKITRNPAVGLAGQEVAVGTAIYTPQNYLSDGTVYAGGFAFAGTTTDDGEKFLVASATGTGSVIGLVERTITGALSVTEEGKEVFPKGDELSIARRGDYYVSATGVATVGQAVLCDPATGKVTYGAVGDANDTGWVVMSASTAEGDTIIVSNRG